MFLNQDQPGSPDKDVAFYQVVPAFGGGISEYTGGALLPTRQDQAVKAVAAYAITDNGKDEWSAEMKIDLEKIGISVAETSALRMNLVRNVGSGGHGSGRSWFPSPAAHRSESSRGWLVLENNPNVVKNADFTGWDEARLLPTSWWTERKNENVIFSDEGVIRFTDAAQSCSLRQNVPVKGGARYRLACRKKVQMKKGNSFLQTSICWRDKDKRAIGYFMKLDAGSDAEMQPLEHFCEAPTNAVAADVILGPYTVNNSQVVAEGNIWIDDVFFGQAVEGEAGDSGSSAKAALSPTEKEEARRVLATCNHPSAADIQKRLEDSAANLDALRRDIQLARLHTEASPGFVLGSVTESDKIYPRTPFHGRFDGPIQLALAGNEYGSFQIAIMPFWTELNDVRVSFTDLSGESGNRIPAESISGFRVDYVRPQKPPVWFQVDFPNELEPDPLLPLTPFTVKANETAAVWVDVQVPEGTPRGRYRGHVSVTANGQTQTREVEVCAYGFDIPKISSIANEFWLTPSNWRAFYGNGNFFTPALHAKWTKTLGQYRVSAFPVDCQILCPQMTIYAEPDGSFSFDWTVFDQYVKNALDNGTTAFWSSLSCNSGWTVYLHDSKTKVVERATGKVVELGRFLPKGCETPWDQGSLPYRENRVYRDFLTAYVKHLKALGIQATSYYEIFGTSGWRREY